MVYLSEYDAAGRQKDRHTEHELGRSILRFGLEKNFGRNYEVGRDENGKPVLQGAQDIFFNISHTKGLVVCGISKRAIGVDTEYIRPFDRRLMRRVCTEDEIAYIYEGSEGKEDLNQQWERFFRLWTLKESYLKATGQGIAVPMREVCFSPEGREDGRDRIRPCMTGWGFRQFQYGGRFIVAVCESVNRRKNVEKRINMTYEEIFQKVKELVGEADVSGIKEHLAYQFNITGEGEGAFYIEVREGKLYVEPYEYYDRDSLFICNANVLFKLISGKLDPVLAFTTGRLKVEGDLGKALKLKDFVSK